MKMKSKLMPMVALAILAVTGSMFIYGGNRQGDDAEQEEQEILNGILTDDNVIDMGDHMAVYRTELEERDSRFRGRYLAFCDLETDQTIYLPDVYGEVLDISVKDRESIHVRYLAGRDSGVQETDIPVRFEEVTESGANDRLGITYSIKEKVMAGLQGDVRSVIAEYPKQIWSEEIDVDGQSYEVLFERVCPAYEQLGWTAVSGYADYCLTVKDDMGDTISKQVITDYPIKYEEVYWVMDYSQDGFPDLVFCMYSCEGENAVTELQFLEWNQEDGCYEKDPSPSIPYGNGEVATEIILWNPELSAVIAFSGWDSQETGSGSRSIAVMGMYSFIGGNWECVRELEPMYEAEVYDTDGFPVVQYFKETVYEGQENVTENRIDKVGQDYMPWNDGDCIWSRFHAQNVGLYPDEKWEETEVQADGIFIWKYVRKADQQENRG